MGTTFLNLTNSVLRHFGEVELTSTTFATASGFQAVAKDAVRDAIRQIQHKEREWPFNHQTSSFSLTPSTATLGHTFEYNLQTNSYNPFWVDWESFVLKRSDVLDPTVAERDIPYKDYDEWLQGYRTTDMNISYTDESIREPQFVFRTQNNKIGLSPPADRAYNVEYEWWGYEADLDAYTDTTTIPSDWDYVVRFGAFARCYQHREDIANYNISNARFKEGIDKMRETLINRYVNMRDNRVKG